MWLIQLSRKKIKQSDLKMGRESEFKFFQRRHTNGQHVHEKMLDITNQGNPNWNPQWDSTSHLLGWLSSKWQETSVGEDVKKREHSCPVGVTYIGAALWKTVRKILKKLKQNSHIWSSNFTSGYLSKRNKNTNLKRYMHHYIHCSITYNS